jgi:two-component system alkaline phosphatase synthesis response regulator PhoP
MAKTRILVIEDDAPIRRGIVDALTFRGFDTHEAATLSDGLDMALGGDCDLILLDLVLPTDKATSGDGMRILAQVRQTRPTLPVIILTARGEEADRVKGRKLGADDYVVKPFSVDELLARVDAVLRRSPQRPNDRRQLKIAAGCVDLDAALVSFDDQTTTVLSEREVDLLRYLAQHAGRPIARQELLAHVWRIDPKGIDTRTIDMHVARLREKLRDDPHQPRTVLTVRGKGYMCPDQSGE